MLTSLFGDLGPDRRKRLETDKPEASFAATAILESVATEVNARGQMVDRHQSDLVVSGSPAQAMREHFATGPADGGAALITLIDPVAMWGAAVVKALSDASGQPIERLHLREQTTLRTLATIERTTLVRRHEETLKVYRADVRAPGLENAEIPVALMERSQLTAVIIGPLQAHAVDALLLAVREATLMPTWACPHLLFMLPPGAPLMIDKVRRLDWPAAVQVHLTSESLTSASAVWNAILGVWNDVKQQARAEADAAAVAIQLPADEIATAAQNTAARAETHGPARGTLNPARAREALAELLTLEGLLGCAVVDSTSGLVLAREVREDQPVDMELAGAACSQVLRVHRQAARTMGLADSIDEVMTSSGARQQVIRTVSRHPDLFLVALLDKHRTNLALVRFKLMDIEKGLV